MPIIIIIVVSITKHKNFINNIHYNRKTVQGIGSRKAKEHFYYSQNDRTIIFAVALQ